MPIHPNSNHPTSGEDASIRNSSTRNSSTRNDSTRTDSFAAQDPIQVDSANEAYFDGFNQEARIFDASLLHEPLSVLPTRSMLLFCPADSATDAMRAMQHAHRGCVLITADGTERTPLLGIFTERDVLLKVIDRGRNPATLALEEVMTANPEALPIDGKVAWVLNEMSVGGFRHIPVVNDKGCPVCVISVRDAVQFLVESFPGEILNLPPNFGITSFRTRGGA